MYLLTGDQVLERRTRNRRRQVGLRHRRLSEEQERTHREAQEDLPQKTRKSLTDF